MYFSPFSFISLLVIILVENPLFILLFSGQNSLLLRFPAALMIITIFLIPSSKSPGAVHSRNNTKPPCHILLFKIIQAICTRIL
jgi:hypothetical protein